MNGQGSDARRRRSEFAVLATFGVSTAAAIGVAVVYWSGGHVQAEGALLATSLLGLGAGLVLWANRLLPQGPYVERREPLPTTEEEREAFEDDLERGGGGRRKILVGGLGVAGVALGAALASPIRSLGPNPGRRLLETAWREGLGVVDADGLPVVADLVPLHGLVTVFPEGHTGAADAQVVLVRVEPELLSLPPGRDGWAPNGLVAYSKVCTHAGCPVGLYQSESRTLLCPCHQSAFDVLDGAHPTFGPAAWPLPQLPLVIGDDGLLRAGGELSGPVGPGWWR